MREVAYGTVGAMLSILHCLNLLSIPPIDCLVIWKVNREASRALEGMVLFIYSPLVLYSLSRSGWLVCPTL